MEIVTVILGVIALIVVGVVGLAVVAGIAAWKALGWSSARRVQQAEQVHGMHTIDAEAPGSLRRSEGDPLPALGSSRGAWIVLGRTLDAPMTVTIAGPGAGKGQAIVVPVAHNVKAHRPQHLIVNDPKAEVVEELYAAGDIREAFIYDFGGRGTSALNVVGSPGDAAAFYQALLHEPNSNDPYWAAAAIDLCSAISAATGYAPLTTVYDALRRPKELDRLAQENEDVDIAWNQVSEKTRNSIRSQATAALSPLRNPDIRAVFDAEGAEQPKFGKANRDIVFVHPPSGAGEAGAASKLIGGVIDHLYRASCAGYEAGGPGSYLLIDEAASCLALQNLSNYLNVGRGLGQRIMVVLQDMGQLEAKVGRDNARSIIGSAGAQAWGATQDHGTAKAISDLSGTVRVERESYSESDDDGLKSSGSVSHSTDERPRLKPHHITSLPQFSFFLHDGNPANLEEVAATPWFSYAARLARPNPPELGVLGTPPKTPTAPPSSPAQPSGGHSPSPDTGGPESPTQRPDAAPTTATRVCPNCNAEAPGAAKYCAGCGCPLEPEQAPRYCTECGSKNEAGATECDTCGWKLDG